MTYLFWDTNLFLYLVEGGAHHQAVLQLLQLMHQNKQKTITSALTVCEILVKPVKEQHIELIQRYKQVFAKLPIISIDSEIAETFAYVRGHGIKTPDALQLACAITAQAESFITNDQRLVRYPHTSLRMYSLYDYLDEHQSVIQ